MVANLINYYNLKLDFTDAKEYTFSAKTLELAEKSSSGTKIPSNADEYLDNLDDDEDEGGVFF